VLQYPDSTLHALQVLSSIFTRPVAEAFATEVQRWDGGTAKEELVAFTNKPPAAVDDATSKQKKVAVGKVKEWLLP